MTMIILTNKMVAPYFLPKIGFSLYKILSLRLSKGVEIPNIVNSVVGLEISKIAR